MAKSMKIHMKSSKALGIDVKGLKPYGCDICKKRFRETKLLKNHKKTHTEEKRYACDVCDKKFAGSGSFGSFMFHII
jgi:predicted SprT family Zn-dependent metalloprotease